MNFTQFPCVPGLGSSSRGPCGTLRLQGARWCNLLSASRLSPVRCQSTGQKKASTRDRGASSAKKTDTGERLSKVLAAAGVASRRGAEDLIFSGKVKVNGVVTEVPQTRVSLLKDKIQVDGKLVSRRVQEKFYFALNKPVGCVCTSDPDAPEAKGKRIVLDIFEDWLKGWKRGRPPGTTPPRLFTVGRLDIDSWGLIFITNDGKWAQRIGHPSAGLTKEYVVHPNRVPNNRELTDMQNGCVVEGKLVVPVSVVLENDFLRVVIAEGRKREVRELVASVGLKVKSLKRVRVGGYRMPRNLKVGEFRQMKPKDLQKVSDLNLQTHV
ncbi:hypothetical protein BSKO_00174 [Bryopsis sp. KO-2023]|nr:hypothetical protein BSKO_00174 [Bryopsis sp. KO-2023]